MTVEEILVHVSAPTSRQHDDRVRAFAQAYEAFQAERVLPLDSFENVTAMNQTAVPLNAEPTSSSSAAAGANEPQVPRTVEHLPPQPNVRNIDDGNSSNDTSRVSDSISRSRITNTPLATPVIDDDDDAAVAQLSSQLLTDSLCALLQDPYHASNLSSPPLEPSPSQPPSQFHPCSLPTEIIPAPPRISTGPSAETHITPSLAHLASLPQLAATYTPRCMLRNVRPRERGHWRFDTSGWDEALQREFWGTLEEVVGAGGAGWGTMCFRVSGNEERQGVERDELPGEEEKGGGEHGENEARIYCWGETVRHVYLLAFVASKSKIRRGANAAWIDAEGTAVVQI